MTPILPTTVTTDREVVDARVAVLPIGSFEQHGPHLPLVTDTLIAVAVADEIAKRHPVFLLPPVTFSCSHEHAEFPGSVSISSGTLAAVVNDIGKSIFDRGVRALMLVNGHGGNYVLSNIAQEANARPGLRMGVFPTRDDWQETREAARMATDSHEDMHAGELEVSILLAAFPDLVREGWETDDHTCADRRHLTILGMSAYTPTGVIGRPSLGTAAKGRAALDHLAVAGEQFLKVLDQPSSDG